MGCNSSSEITVSFKNGSLARIDYLSIEDQLPTDLFIYVLSFISYAPRDHFDHHDLIRVKKRLLKAYKKSGGAREKDVISHPLLSPFSGGPMRSMTTLYASYEQHQAITSRKELKVQSFCTLLHVIPLVCRAWRDVTTDGDQLLWRYACQRFIANKLERNEVMWLQKYGLDPSSLEDSSSVDVLQRILNENARVYKSPKQLYEAMFTEEGSQFYRAFMFFAPGEIHPNDDALEITMMNVSEVKAMEDLLSDRPIGDQSGLPMYNGPPLLFVSPSNREERRETGEMPASLVRVKQCSLHGDRRARVKVEFEKHAWISDSIMDESGQYYIGIAHELSMTQS